MMELHVQQCLDRGDCASMVSLLQAEGLDRFTLTRLHRLVLTELISERFARVQLVLQTLEQLSENTDNQQTLLRSGLTSKLLLWFECINNQLTCDRHLNTALINLIEAFYNYFLMLAQPFVPVRELCVILMHLSRAALEPNTHFRLRLEAIRTFNSLLESVNRDQRRAIQTHHHKNCNLSEMAAAIFSAGDYEFQVSLSEALCRLTPKKDRPIRANQWFSPEVCHAFCDIRDADFEVDCRRFLNFLNAHDGNQQSVYTFPCLRAFINSTQLFQPQDENVDEFWVDFNLGSKCVSFFIDNPNGFLWECIHLPRNDVNDYRFTERSGTELLLAVDLINPIIHRELRGQRVELLFSAELHSQISAVIGRVFKKPSVFPSSVRTYNQRKTPKKKLLRVLPLSPSSEERSVVKSSGKSRAEILFDQIKHLTPVHKSGISVEEAGFQVSHDQEAVIGGSSSPSLVINEVARCDRKRPFLESGYLSDHTEATPTQQKRVESAAEGEESMAEGTDLVSKEVETVNIKLVQPLSSPSSERDSVVKSSKRSRTEILLDQIKHSTPVYKSGISVEEAGLQVSHDQEALIGGSSSPSLVINEVVRGDRKRPFLESGYLSDHTEDTPTQQRRVESAAEEEEESAAEGEEFMAEGTDLVSKEVETVNFKLDHTKATPTQQKKESEEQDFEGVRLNSDITAVYKSFTSQLQHQFRSHWQQVECQVLKSQSERQVHVSKLMSAVQQYREMQLQRLENSACQQLQEFTSIHSSIMTFFEAENQRLNLFCQQLQHRLKSTNESEGEKGVQGSVSVEND